jgi:hypothetical protein
MNLAGRSARRRTNNLRSGTVATTSAGSVSAAKPVFALTDVPA